MKTFLSRKLIIAATGLVMLGGAAGALAASEGSGHSGSQAYINDLANRLSVTPAALTAAIKATDSDQIAAALAAGHLTQSQATALDQRIQQSTTVPFLGRRFDGRGRRGGLAVGVTAAAGYLGITKATLRSDLKAGESLAAIASSTAGKSTAGLKAAITAAETTRLGSAVSNGTITSQQEQTRLADLSTRIDALLARTWTGGGHGAPTHRLFRG